MMNRKVYVANLPPQATEADLKGLFSKAGSVMSVKIVKDRSIMAGRDSVFSLFPPENAAGNFVKIVQRIPVKVAFEKVTDPGRLLRIGISAVPTILVER